MHNVTPTDRHAQSGSPKRVQIPSTTGLEDTVSMFITPPFRCRHCGQLLGHAQATRDVSTPVTPFVALTPVLSSDTGRPMYRATVYLYLRTRGDLFVAGQERFNAQSWNLAQTAAAKKGSAAERMQAMVMAQCCLNIPTSRRQAARTTSLPHRREDDFRVAVETPVDLTPPARIRTCKIAACSS